MGLGKRAALLLVGALSACSAGSSNSHPSPQEPPADPPLNSSNASASSKSPATALNNPLNCAGVVDACPVSSGITWQCKQRFMTGINYAWHTFGGDFGGIAKALAPGVAHNPAIADEIADMKAQGANIIRWWVFPDLRGDGIQLDASGTPLGLGGTFGDDLNAAMQLAERNDVYLMLTIFSFDAFRPAVLLPLAIPGLQPLILDPVKSRALIANVIAPMAALIESSRYKKRVIAWDLINEPEWATAGVSLYGDPDFTPTTGLQTLTHTQMQTFLIDLTTALRAKSHALITVGSAAAKWKHAWTALNLDFYQFHIYDWVDQQWPYTDSPEQLGITGKPVVIGEFPLNGLTRAPYHALMSSWLNNGYAGGLAWSESDPNFDWPTNKTNVLLFAKTQPCELSF